MNARNKFRLNLSTSILISLALGVLTGIFFGEYCAHLQIIGDAFIKLLQMTILPYIVVSLIAGIGGLSHDQAKILGIKSSQMMVLFWGIAFLVILIMPLAFPKVESASFFSSSLVEIKEEVDYLDLFIPSNPFKSLAESVIPAAVLFSLSVGVALIGIKEKQNLIDDLSVLSAALTRVARFVVYLTPIGVFAISASAAGTMTLEEFGRLEVYFVTFNAAALFLTFWILPMLVVAITPFSYKDIISVSKDALITGFATGKLFIILPVLIQNSNTLLDKYKLNREDTGSLVDIIIPVFFNFPNIGKLLTLLFILFAAWFSGNSLSVREYPGFLVTGLFSLFGSTDVAVPFLLDHFQIPSDLFQLFVVTGILNKRCAVLLAATNLLTLTLLTTCAVTGHLSIRWKKLLRYSLTTALLTVVVVGGARVVLGRANEDPYTKDNVIAGMHLLRDPVDAVVRTEAPPLPVGFDNEKPLLEQIRERGVLRVGYHPDRLPFSFFNTSGELVGFDIEMAHRLARELGVTVEFIPFELEAMVEQVNRGQVDMVMSGIPITTDWLGQMSFSNPYLDVTYAVVVRDHDRDRFETVESVKEIRDVRIGVVGYHGYFVAKIEEALPLATVVPLESTRDFFENNEEGADALLTGAEIGAAWTLLYPDYQVVVPKPTVTAQPLGYPIGAGDPGMVDFMNRWIDLKRKDKTIEKTYNYWILGQGAAKKEPRWSVLRNVLHWVD